MDLKRIEELRKKGFSYREIFSQQIEIEERISELEEFRKRLEKEIKKICSEVIRECDWVIDGYCTLWGWDKHPRIKGVRKIGRRWHKKANPFRCVFCYRVI